MATEQEVKDHPIWSAIEQVATIKGEAALVDTALDPQAFGLVHQVFEFVTFAEVRIQRCPAALLSRQALTQLHKSIVGSTNEIRNFVNNKNIGHLTNAYNNIEQQGIPALALVPILGGEEVGKIADDFGSQVQGILKSALDERDRLRKEREDLAAAVAELTGQVKQLSETVIKQSTDAQNVVQTVQTQYAAKEQKFDQEFKAASEVKAQEHAGLVAKLQADTKNSNEELERRAIEVIRVMETDRDHAKDILKIIGNIGVTGNYQKTAESEAKMANTWRWVTVGFFAISIGVGVWALFKSHDVDLRLTIARILFAFLVLGTTVYTGRESARHRTTADRAKRVELELASLGPFMESLEPEKQSELRAKLTELYFGKEGEAHKLKSDVSAKDLLSLIKTFIERHGK